MERSAAQKKRRAGEKRCTKKERERSAAQRRGREALHKGGALHTKGGRERSAAQKRREGEKRCTKKEGGREVLHEKKEELVVIAGEVGGRWSQETKDFLWCLASVKAACVPRRLYGSARAAWYRRWSCLLACSTAKSVASSLLGVR